MVRFIFTGRVVVGAVLVFRNESDVTIAIGHLHHVAHTLVNTGVRLVIVIVVQMQNEDELSYSL